MLILITTVLITLPLPNFTFQQWQWREPQQQHAGQSKEESKEERSGCFSSKKHCSGQFVKEIFLNVPFFVDNFVETGFAHSLIDSVTRVLEPSPNRVWYILVRFSVYTIL